MSSVHTWQAPVDQPDDESLKELVSSFLIAEEHAWLSCGTPLLNSTTSRGSTGTRNPTDENEVTGNPGLALLRHGQNIHNIHKYFQNLEPHRYCLSLTAKTKKLAHPYATVRLVRGDSHHEPLDQATSSHISYQQERQLREKDPEFELFEMATHCALFPVLGAPPTPSPYSPTPAVPTSPDDGERRRVFSFGSVPLNTGFEDSSYSPPSQLANSTLPPGASDNCQREYCVSPEPVVPIHSDMLRDLVCKAFCISNTRQLYLEKIVKEKHLPKSPDRVLVEGLLLQLSLLETNRHPFYRVQAFLDKNGYSEWLIQEKEQISRRIKNFWHFPLPPMHNLPLHIVDAHEQYKVLLTKLIRHESSNKTPHSVFGDVTPTGPLSPSSCRLLKEFALRYGVGELYRRLVHLKYMAEHFESEAWYIKHVTDLLENVMSLVTRTTEIYVKEELIMLLQILTLLLRNSKNCLTHIRRLFPDNVPPGAVSSLVTMAALVNEAGEFLKIMFPVVFVSVREAIEFAQSLYEEPFSCQLEKLLKEEMKGRYDRFKVIAMDELHGHCYSTYLSPRLLNIIILNIRDEVNTYRAHFKQEFERYVDVVELAIATHYRLLMQDVLELCQQYVSGSDPSEVDLPMLSLAFRLSAIDQEWCKYISPRSQLWRGPYLGLALIWLEAVGKHIQDYLPQFLRNDKWKTVEVPRATRTFPEARPPGFLSVSPMEKAASRISITQSERSAFRAPQQKPREAQLRLQRSRPAPVPSMMQRYRMTTSYPDVSASLPEKRSIEAQGPLSHKFGSDTNLVHYGKDHTKMTNQEFKEQCEFHPKALQAQHGHATDKGQEREGQFASEEKTQRIEDIDSSTLLEYSSQLSERVTSHEDSQRRTSERVTPYANRDSSSPDSTHSSDSLEFVKDKWTKERNQSATRSRSDSPSVPDEGQKHPGDSSAILRPVANRVRPRLSDPSTVGRTNTSSSTLRSSDIRGLCIRRSKLIDTDASTEYSSCRTTSVAGSFATAREDISDDSCSTQSSGSEAGYETSISSNGSDTPPSVSARACDVASQDQQRRKVPLTSSVVDVLCCVHRVTAFTCHLSKVLCPSTMGAEEDTLYIWDTVKEMKTRLCRKLLQVIWSLVGLYADHVISLETCGLTADQKAEVLDELLARHLETEEGSRTLAGCQFEHGLNRKCSLCSPGWKTPPCESLRSIVRRSRAPEPVSQEMGARLSNIIVLHKLLSWLQDRVTSSLSCLDLLPGRGELSVKSETYCKVGPTSDGHDGTCCVDEARSLADPIEIDTDGVSPCERELVQVEAAHIRLIAFRLDQFFNQMLHTLLSLSLPAFDLHKRLQPASEFLNRRLSSLRQVMFPECFSDLLVCLWTHLAQGFSDEAKCLKEMEGRASNHAKLLLQALAYFMQFFHGQGDGLDLDTLSATTEDVSKHLELYTSTTARLIRMYRWLARQMFQIERLSRADDFYSSVSSCSHQSHAHEPADTLIQALRTQLHATRKCFSGSQFVDWVREYVNVHGYDSLGVCIGSTDTETGLELGHHLLERNLLICLGSRRDNQQPSSDSRDDVEYTMDTEEVSVSLPDRGRGSVVVWDQPSQGHISVNQVSVSKRSHRPGGSPSNSSHPSSPRPPSRSTTLSPELLDSTEDTDYRGLTDTVESIIYRATGSQTESMDFCNSDYVYYTFLLRDQTVLAHLAQLGSDFMCDDEGNEYEFKYKLDFMDRFTIKRKLQQILCVLNSRKSQDIEAKLFLRRLPPTTVSEAIGEHATTGCFHM